MPRDTLLGCPPELSASSPTCWWLVFCEGRSRHWWDRVFRTPPGFSHVYALRWDGWNWILFNPHAAFTEIEIMPYSRASDLRCMIGPDATALEIETFRRIDGIRGRWWAGPMTCVEQIKALLGLPVDRIWTPWQLFRYLEHANGYNPESTKADRSGKRARAPYPKVNRRIDPR